uniref:Synembryn n=1 Tax=Seriola lalandi dorsalis TaxID=1841481 RepID=A0A3B4XMF4_SERLL
MLVSRSLVTPHICKYKRRTNHHIQVSCSADIRGDGASGEEEGRLTSRLATALLSFISSQLQPAVLRVCLHTLRILSRDRRALGPMVTDSALLTLAHLGDGEVCRKEAMKVLCNVVYNSPRAQERERGVSVLTSALEQCLAVRWGEGYEVLSDRTSPPISKETSQEVIEILKTLFNIAHTYYRQEPDEVRTHRSTTLPQHTVNILSALPLTCLDVLISVRVDQASHRCEGVNMDCVHTLLLFMDRRLNRASKLKEKLTPVLNLLTESSRVHRETRHYLRQKILPPLRDVAIRPEQDTTLRGQLVRLMTHVDTDLKDCAAELLFVLCKEDVSRFVKYTGYGNAAGLLAARGLLNGRRNSGASLYAAQYSSDSDSDTEEYREARARINLVTGRVEAEQPDPMEGMTEEEKEEEALRLISMINRLSQ